MPTSANRSSGGYSIIEIVVALATASTVGMLALSSYVFVAREWQGQGQVLATQQSLRDVIDSLTQEIRLGGTCLPSAGPADGSIRPLAGTDSGTTDSITVRSNVVCASGTVQSPVNAGANQINLDTVQNFTVNTWAYLLSADTTFGQYFLISGVNTSANRLSVDPTTPITTNYPSGSSVYGAESRTYAIDTSGAVPVLTVASLGQSAQRAVAGVERLNIRYILNNPQNCNADAGACTIVDLPASASEWASVRLVELDIGARSSQQVTGGGVNGFFQLSQVIRVKPRNFVF